MTAAKSRLNASSACCGEGFAAKISSHRTNLAEPVPERWKFESWKVGKFKVEGKVKVKEPLTLT